MQSTELLGGAFGDESNRKLSGDRERGVSPIPSSHPSRTGAVSGGGTSGAGFFVQGNGKGKGIWDGGWTGSWTTLQGIASSVLGGDLEQDLANSRGVRGRNSTAKKEEPATWGPSLPVPKSDRIAKGSLEDRDRAVKAMKTASVLESHERVNGGLDVRGKHKRRVSTDEARPDEQDEEAMVYVHPVQPNDTVTGVVLKYNCQPAAFRKANRLWPNDVIQIRKVVLLPVDACGIRGRACDAPKDGSGVDLLAPTPSAEDPPSSSRHTNGGSWGYQNGAADSSPFDPLLHSEPATLDGETDPWIHVRWVLVDSSPNSKPVSIARIRRKDLGYFPPRRRKSQTTTSAISTPRTSFDIPGSTITPPVPGSPLGKSTRPRQSSNLSARPLVTSYFPLDNSQSGPLSGLTGDGSVTKRGHSRKSSFTAGDSQPAAWMQGPGGVGTFARNVKKPGPAQDGLNSWAAKHLPGLAIDYLPSKSILGGETVKWGVERIEEEGRNMSASGTATPATGREQVQGGLGLENAAAAIESWVRRIALRGPGTPKLGPNRGTPGGLDPPVGDLIELLDGTGSDDGRGFEPSVEAVAAAAGGSGRDDLIGSLRGRGTGKSAKSE